MQAKVDAAMRLLASKPKPTIAFHARGGDKRDEDIKCARKRVCAALSPETRVNLTLLQLGMIVRCTPQLCVRHDDQCCSLSACPA